MLFLLPTSDRTLIVMIGIRFVRIIPVELLEDVLLSFEGLSDSPMNDGQNLVKGLSLELVLECNGGISKIAKALSTKIVNERFLNVWCDLSFKILNFLKEVRVFWIAPLDLIQENRFTRLLIGRRCKLLVSLLTGVVSSLQGKNSSVMLLASGLTFSHPNLLIRLKG